MSTDLTSSRKQPFAPVDSKQKVLGKFLELSTLREPTHIRSFSLNQQLSSSQITSHRMQQSMNEYNRQQQPREYSFTMSSPTSVLPASHHQVLEDEEEQLKVQMPARMHGASRNIYKFTKLREQYRDQYI